jgi:hypothetical protein
MTSKAQILWNEQKQKYQLTADGKVLVTSKDKGYLNYLVVYQKHSAIIEAGITAVEVMSRSSDDLAVVAPTEQVARPHVSALLWEDLLKKPFEVTTEYTPIKTRGRPRKYLPTTVGKHDHKMSDEESDVRNLLPSSIEKLIMDYKEYVQEGKTPKQALDEVCKLYRVPYGQAFNICVDEL